MASTATTARPPPAPIDPAAPLQFVINAVAQAAHAQGCALGVLPQGTFNDFARTHGTPADAQQAVQMLLTCEPLPVQVGLINDHVFLVNASHPAHTSE